MQGFELSPGITPFIIDIAILGFTLSFGFTGLLRRKSSYLIPLLVLGVDTAIVSVFKLYTDYADFWDSLLAVVILVEVFFALQLGLNKLQSGLARNFVIFFGIIGLFLSVYKIFSDFYDPFDLLLSCLGVLCAIVILEERVRNK